MRRSRLIRLLEEVEGFPDPSAELEQVITPSEAAADLLLEALARGDLEDRTVIDLGTGTGRLAIGAALLGARRVRAVDLSEGAIDVARNEARRLGARAEFEVGHVADCRIVEQTVIMNPPFGAQRRRADRPFWSSALSGPGRAVYSFASGESRSFIERLAVERHARIEATRPVDWDLPRTFAHHRRPSVKLPVDLWVLRTAEGRS